MKNDPLQNLPDGERAKISKTDMPNWFEPMLTKLSHRVFSKKGWMYECKLNGDRI